MHAAVPSDASRLPLAFLGSFSFGGSFPPSSNFRLNNEHLFRHVDIPAEQVIPINPELVRSPRRAAEDYEERLEALFEDGGDDSGIDLALLGIGPDGHTCSLFPGHRAVS